METVPNSMIRLRVKAGSHRIAFSAGGKSFDRTISGMTGEVRLVGITGTDWSWGSSSHAWADDSDDQVKRQARRSRLIKDISLLMNRLGQMVESVPSRPTCYYLSLKADAGSVPCSTTNTKNPNPYRLGFFCSFPQHWRGFRPLPLEHVPRQVKIVVA